MTSCSVLFYNGSRSQIESDVCFCPYKMLQRPCIHLHRDCYLATCAPGLLSKGHIVLSTVQCMQPLKYFLDCHESGILILPCFKQFNTFLLTLLLNSFTKETQPGLAFTPIEDAIKDSEGSRKAEGFLCQHQLQT